MKEIKLTQGQTSLVDDFDFEDLLRYSWCAVWNRDRFYAERGFWVNGRVLKVKLHRRILGLIDPKIKCDHIDGNGLNNQRHNLRIATNQQNSANMKKQINCSSKYKGVYQKQEKGKWCSRIEVNRKRIYLGYFDNEIDAARAYDKAATEAFGGFAKLNFPSNVP